MTTAPLRISPWFQDPRRAERPRPVSFEAHMYQGATMYDATPTTPAPETPAAHAAAPSTATAFQETARTRMYRGAHARPPEDRTGRAGAEPGDRQPGYANGYAHEYEAGYEPGYEPGTGGEPSTGSGSESDSGPGSDSGLGSDSDSQPAFDALHEALFANAELPGVGRFSLRPVDPPGDLELLHEWMNDPETALYWELDGPVGRVAAHLREQARLPYTAAYVGVLNGLPMSYWELYRADLDPLLAGRYPAQAGDAGIHLLVGPAGQRGRGIGSALLGDTARRALAAFPQASRVLAEPDVRNVRSVRAFVRAGFRHAAEIDLEGKRAALMVRERAG